MPLEEVIKFILFIFIESLTTVNEFQNNKKKMKDKLYKEIELDVCTSEEKKYITENNKHIFVGMKYQKDFEIKQKMLKVQISHHHISLYRWY